MKYIIFLILFFTFFALFVYNTTAYAVFNESMDPEQIVTEVIEQKQESTDRYDKIDKSISKEEAVKIQNEPLIKRQKQKALDLAQEKKDIFIGFALIVTAAVLYLITVMFKRGRKLK